MGRSPRRNPSDEIEGLKKGPWSSQEDQLLIDYIHKHGPGNWQLLPKRAGLNRCGKSCRLRWTNYLRPDIKRGNFLPEEEQTIIDLHSSLGNKWSMIARRLPGRTDNEIKNFWNTRLRKKLLFSRIDPNTHRPIPDSVLPGNLIHNPLESLASIRLLHDMLQMLNYFHRPQDAMSSPLHVAPADIHLPFLNNLGMPLEFDPGNRSGTMSAIDSSEQCLPGLVPVPTGPRISSGDQVLDSGSSAVMDEVPGDSFWRDILVESFFDPLD